MTRQLREGVWSHSGVYYKAGMSEADLGDFASQVGDHLWEATPEAEVPTAAVAAQVMAPPLIAPDAGQSETATPDAPAPKPAAEVDPDQDDAVTDGAQGEQSTPQTVPAEPEPAVEAPEPGVEGGPPPRSGPGSGESEWRAYASQLGVDVTSAESRKDIIAAIEAAGRPV